MNSDQQQQDSQFDFKPDESNINLRLVEENQQREQKEQEEVKIQVQNQQVHLRLTQVDSYDKISIEGDNEDYSPQQQQHQQFENVNKKNQDTTPDAFLCPITFDIMDEPVFLVESGHTFEKVALQEWLQNNNTCPLTQTELITKQFVTNWSLKKAIEEWKQLNKK